MIGLGRDKTDESADPSSLGCVFDVVIVPFKRGEPSLFRGRGLPKASSSLRP
jgi:hypothetical protein